MTSNTFTVTVSWPSTVDDQRPLEASGLGFIFGPTINGPSSYCPESVGSFCPNSTATVFTANGGAMVSPAAVIPHFEAFIELDNRQVVCLHGCLRCLL